MVNALKEYHDEVKAGTFPAPQNTYAIEQHQLDKFYELVGENKGQGEQSRAVQEDGVRVHG